MAERRRTFHRRLLIQGPSTRGAHTKGTAVGGGSPPAHTLMIERQQPVCDRVDPVPERWRASDPLPASSVLSLSVCLTRAYAFILQVPTGLTRIYTMAPGLRGLQDNQPQT